MRRDDGELLRVLAAEVRAARSDDREQLGDDGRHAVEVRRAGAAPHRSVGQPGDVHRRRRRHRVHLGDARSEHASTPSSSHSLEIVGEVARIAVEILVRAELQRVDEDRDDDEVGLGPRGRDE